MTPEEERENECVICLIEIKDTMLLPCRHLCVCQSCFLHIDKCPICRVNFDNYVHISSTASTNSNNTNSNIPTTLSKKILTIPRYVVDVPETLVYYNSISS